MYTKSFKLYLPHSEIELEYDFRMDHSPDYSTYLGIPTSAALKLINKWNRDANGAKVYWID
jgi:hypothetical protein